MHAKFKVTIQNGLYSVNRLLYDVGIALHARPSKKPGVPGSWLGYQSWLPKRETPDFTAPSGFIIMGNILSYSYINKYPRGLRQSLTHLR